MVENYQPDGNYRRNLRRVIWLIIPTWLAFVVEAVGGWRFSMDTYSSRYAISLGGLYDLVIMLTMGAVVASPVLVVIGLFAIRQNQPRNRGRMFSVLRLLLVISLMLSMFSCVWSCGGHPTWTSGYK